MVDHSDLIGLVGIGFGSAALHGSVLCKTLRHPTVDISSVQGLNCQQRCHSKQIKNLDGIIRKPKKTQGKISKQLAEVSEKIQLFRRKFLLFTKKLSFIRQNF